MSLFSRRPGIFSLASTELDQLLHGERFVDLYAVVRQGMRISKESYSIKQLEAFYWSGERNSNEDVADAMASVIAYERWLVEGGPDTLAAIEANNRDDAASTHDLHTWLEDRRTELEDAHGAQPRPHQEPPEQGKAPSPEELAELDLADRLRAAGAALLADLGSGTGGRHGRRGGSTSASRTF